MLWQPTTLMSRPVRFSTTTVPEICPPALTVFVERTSVAESEGRTATTRIAVASAAMQRSAPAAMAIRCLRLTQAILFLGISADLCLSLLLSSPAQNLEPDASNVAPLTP
jgi:hypothetical protein